MGIHDLSRWQHAHAFDEGNRHGERRTWMVVAITAVTMVAEIVGGILTGSMALLADGWHMSTHVVALSIAGIAYALARRWSRDERFAFGTWKIEVLGAFSSALLLGVVAIAMGIESVHRLVDPAPIRFGPALFVAVTGLAVNIASAFLLHGSHSHGDAGHGHEHDHGRHDHHAHEHPEHPEHGHHRHDSRDVHDHAAPGHHDLNLRSAYVHVLADALTSVFAIAALALGLWAGWTWLDPVMGLVGGIVIAVWAKGLLTNSARVLLDREMDSPIVDRIRGAIESDNDAEIADLHVWRVGRASHAVVMCIVAHDPLSPAAYRRRLDGIESLAHVSVEVNRCEHQRCP
ncbi:MAG TPA: CDF family Co(II)/Ni(II) efflux transporter DmeF [Usitatibacter sp.]|jgi:cation diffusion facilitator family transporter|nr:CDF family Co(II)/Ni(II) efflux transporter DmeF [Usitatibacter sp.]